jgi:hypothetical protein
LGEVGGAMAYMPETGGIVNVLSELSSACSAGPAPNDRFSPDSTEAVPDAGSFEETEGSCMTASFHIGPQNDTALILSVNDLFVKNLSRSVNF